MLRGFVGRFLVKGAIIVMVMRLVVPVKYGMRQVFCLGEKHSLPGQRE